ncbi:MAG TPA: hypothetical protein VNG51_01195 [Ktedonobacteraceae bacterium]|nr:hypothetical protein [Ktedonobacteraceae bacterium]
MRTSKGSARGKNSETVSTATPEIIHFGAFVKVVRHRQGIRQSQVLAHLPGWTQTTYSRVETDELAPAFDQLAAIYAALCQVGVAFTPQDRQQFLTLARLRIESKRTYLERKSDQEWDELRLQLSHMQHNREEPVQQRQRTSQPHLVETRHLIGREDWLASVIASLQGPLPKKLVVLQGPVGIGKSSELHRIALHFLSSGENHPHILLCDMPVLEREAGPESMLDLFLGTVLAEFGPADSAMQSATLIMRSQLVLEYLEKAARPFLLLIDNAEQLLDTHGSIAPCWEQFLRTFLRSQHRTSLVLATREWPGWFEGERAFLAERAVPALSVEDGAALLQQLGLTAIPVASLRQAVENVGGVPLCLEWLASLVQEPLWLDTWEESDDLDEEEDTSDAQEMMTRRLSRLLDDTSLFGGPIANKLTPLLNRILEKRLSPEAVQVLQVLACATMPLGKPALQVICLRPRLLKELRVVSLLAAYPHRVQVLPMVAAQIRAYLSHEQRHHCEEQLIEAYSCWLDKGTVGIQEAGAIVTALTELYLMHHRLLEAAQLLIYYGWLSFNLGYAPRLARLSAHVMQNFDGHISSQNQCGGLLLHYVLAPFLGKINDEEKKVEDFQTAFDLALAGKVTLQPATEMHLIRHLMLYHMNNLQFEKAQSLLKVCSERLKPSQSFHIDIQASLLAQHAWLLARWSEYLEEQNSVAQVQSMREQTINLYRECCTLLLSSQEASPPLKSYLLKKRLFAYLNSLGYHLNRNNQLVEALHVLEQSLDLGERGYCNFGALTAVYGEISQTLMALGRFHEAVLFDEKAFAELQRGIDAGYAIFQEEIWVYRVNRGRLYLRIGKVAEAEALLQGAIHHIHPKRRIYRMFAKEALEEIEQWRQQAISPHYQLDWRWINRYRTLGAYDAYWWWAQAGTFTEEEQQQWDQWYRPTMDEVAKERLGGLIAQSRQREITAALSEQREPHFTYPALQIEEVRNRITAFLELDTTICQEEPNALVRFLYHGVIEDEVSFLRMIESTYEKNTERFWELNQRLFPIPTVEEMDYALGRVRRLLQQGFEKPETAEISQKLIHFLQERLYLSLDLSNGKEEPLVVQEQEATLIQQTISPQAAKRFYETILHESGFDGWQVIIDPTASGGRIESGLRQFFIQDIPVTLDRVRYYVAHELAGHVARSMAGERSLIGLLGIGTQDYSTTEEGLALYHERQTAALHGQPFSDSSLWLGTLATGLASGVATPPQTFHSLYMFFALFYLLHRRIWKPNEDMQVAQERTRQIAISRCLRTYRGVPDLERAGICLSSDVVYLRGIWKIERAVAQDETILDRLAIGKIAYELLPMVQDLEIASPPQPLRQLAYHPELDAYILSFDSTKEDDVNMHKYA